MVVVISEPSSANAMADIIMLNEIKSMDFPSIKTPENQTACGHPTLKDGVCFGPHALAPGFMESRNRRAFVAQIPMIRIIVTLFSVPIESLLIKSKKI